MSLPFTEVTPFSALEPRERRESDDRKLEAVARPVLVVEDDPSSREVLTEMLGMWGYEAIPVGSAEEAEYAMKRKLIGAAIVDVFLPGKSGANLMSKLREKFPDATLIGISALSDASMARRCKGLGADTFIGKPIPPERLAEALRSRHQSWH